jgi:hypothetical protein
MADPYYRLRARIKSRSLEQVRDAAALMGQALDNEVPVATGELKRSQRISVSESENRVSVNISYEAPYWKVTDQGAPAHEIHAKNEPMLRFFWEGGPDGDRWYKFLMVNHPGQQGTNWYSDTVTAQNWSDALYDASQP